MNEEQQKNLYCREALQMLELFKEKVPQLS